MKFVSTLRWIVACSLFVLALLFVALCISFAFDKEASLSSFLLFVAVVFAFAGIKLKPKKQTNSDNCIRTDPCVDPNPIKTAPKPVVLENNLTKTEIGSECNKNTCKSSYEIEKLSSKKALVNFRNSPYIVFDTETTGLSAENDEIIEISLLKISPDSEPSDLTSLFKPKCRISQRITDITGITNRDVANAPCVCDKIFEIADFIGDATLVAHNASFDAKFLTSAFNENGISKDIILVDTLQLARKAFPDMPNHKLNTLISKLHLKDGNQEHRAKDDVMCTKALLDRCIDKLIREKEAESAARKLEKAAAK